MTRELLHGLRDKSVVLLLLGLAGEQLIHALGAIGLERELRVLAHSVEHAVRVSVLNLARQAKQTLPFFKHPIFRNSLV